MDTLAAAGGSEAQALDQLAQRLRERFPDVHGEAIDQVMAEALLEFDGRPIRDFVPIFVERSVVERFRHGGGRD